MRALGDVLGRLDRAGIERLADALERLHLQEGGAPFDEGVREVARSLQAPDRVYDEAIRHFTAHERTLREQSSVAASLLGRLRERQRTATQHLVRLVAAPGAVAGGRFVLENSAEGPLTFDFHPRFELPCRFSPPRVALPPGGTAAVDVRIELDRTFAPDETATLLVDVVADEVVRSKLWIDIRIVPEAP